MLKRTLNLIIVLFLAVISTSFVGDLQYKKDEGWLAGGNRDKH